MDSVIDFGKYVNKDRLIRRFVEMVKINSLSGEEEAISLYLQEEFRKLGCEAVREDCGNVVAHFPANGKTGTIMFCAHMDTVGREYDISPIIEEGTARSSALPPARRASSLIPASSSA